MCDSSAMLILSGQKRCPCSARIAASDEATELGGPGEFGYFGWPTILSRPFSVMGHVAKLRLPKRENQSCA